MFTWKRGRLVVISSMLHRARREAKLVKHGAVGSKSLQPVASPMRIGTAPHRRSQDRGFQRNRFKTLKPIHCESIPFASCGPCPEDIKGKQYLARQNVFLWAVKGRRRFGRGISEIPLKPIGEAGLGGSSRSPRHFDALHFLSGIFGGHCLACPPNLINPRTEGCETSG